MTTLNLNTASAVRPATKGERIRRAARSDLLAVRATPTVWILLFGSAVMAAASASANLAVLSDRELTTAASAQLIMHASTVATLVFAAVAGVIGVTSDLRFGRLDQATLSEPVRSTVVGAKAAVTAAVGLLYGLTGTVVALTTWAVTLSVRGAAVDLGRREIVLALCGVVPGAALFAVAGIAVGLVVRNQAGAIAGLLAWLLIVEPTLLIGLPRVGRWLPGAAGLAFTNSPDENLLTQGVGGLLLLAYAAVLIATAAHRFESADL